MNNHENKTVNFTGVTHFNPAAVTKNIFKARKSTFERGNYRNLTAEGPLLHTVFGLRYESYVEQGYISKNTNKLFMDEYDSRPSCTSFLTLHNNNPIGSIRCCIYNPDDERPVPIMEVFDKEIAHTIGYDNPFMELNKLVVSPAFQRQGGVEARFMILENAARHALEKGIKCGVIAVRDEHVRYYHALFGFKQASESKSYPLLNFKTTLMYTNNPSRILRRLDKRLKGQYAQNDSLLSNRIR